MKFFKSLFLLLAITAASFGQKSPVRNLSGQIINNGSGAVVNSQQVGYQTLNVLDGWANANRYSSATSVGPQANTTDFSIYAVFLPNTQAISQLLIGKSNSVTSTQGYSLGAVAGAYRFYINNIASPPCGFTDLEVGKIAVIHGVVRGGQIYLYKNGVPVFGSTSIGSYTNTTFSVNIGSYSGGPPFQSGIISAGICSATGLTDAQVEAHYQALMVSAYSSPTGATHLWRAVDAGATWVDQISSLSLTRAGTVNNTTQVLAFYDRYDYRVHSSDTARIGTLLPNTIGSLDVMFVGDSRTAGTGDTHGGWSFRQAIYNLFTASGDMTNIRFVGPNSSPVTDPEHNGNPGWTTGNHLTGLAGKISIYTALSTYDPDIVVIYIGTNSTASDANMAQERADYRTMMDAIFAFKPDMRFVVVEETEVGDGIQKSRIEAHNNWFWRTEWPRCIAAGMKLIRVKMFDVVKISAGQYADNVHMNDAGYAAEAPPIWYGIRKSTDRNSIPDFMAIPLLLLYLGTRIDDNRRRKAEREIKMAA